MRSGIISTLISNSEGRPARERAAEEQRFQRAVEGQRFQQPIREEQTRTPILSRAQARQQRQNEDQDQERDERDTHAHRVDMGEDEDSDYSYDERFQERHIRHKFIRCVYMILTVQLIATAAIVCFFQFYKPAFLWMIKATRLFHIYVGIAILAIGFLIFCFEAVRKTFPYNFILLFIFTALEGLGLSWVVVRYPNDDVLLALGCTAAIVIGLTIFAFQTKCDFTACWAILFCCLIILLCMMLVLFFFYDKKLHIVYASIGLVVFSVYLIYDTQMIMGGKTKFEIEPTDYILGAINLYMDIIFIFTYILQLIGLSSD